MTNRELVKSGQAATGVLAKLEREAHGLALHALRTVNVKAGQRVFSPGDSCVNYLIVKQGTVRVSTTAESGREIVLYHVDAGETCVLTAACLMSGADYDAEGVAETDTEAYIIPKPMFDEMLGTSPQFRRYVFSSYGERLNTLISLVQEITVKHMDRRLARFLLAHAEADVIAMTHQAIATELNTAREVVSRLLGDFASRNWVRIERGRVHLLNWEELASFASEV